ncbi:lipopolysaccharide assembly protein LapA domain-containing protein [Actinoplanes sp. NPDC051633]|uniref:lipopolysaccharide assembly protein LapA domain-containing protein n=1 Tax=Actinoplanes sp. NPDC051633 TaxID=3155670 RepID=UPI00344A25EE
MTAAQNYREHPTPDNNHTSSADGTPPAHAGPPVPRSRTGGLWVAAVAFAAVLLLLLIFVLQNGQRADVSFLGIHGKLPLGVALLLAAVFGVLLVALPGTARIVQLRLLGRRRGRRRAATASPVDPAPPPEDPARR